MIFYLAGLQNIPDELYEAAKIDGANAFQQFTRITVPLLKPIILLPQLLRPLAHYSYLMNRPILPPGV